MNKENLFPLISIILWSVFFGRKEGSTITFQVKDYVKKCVTKHKHIVVSPNLKQLIKVVNHDSNNQDVVGNILLQVTESGVYQDMMLLRQLAGNFK